VVKNLLIMLISLTLLTGCADQRVLEKLGFTHTTSYDLLPNGNLKVTITIPKEDPEVKATRELLTTVAKSSKEAKMKLSRQTNLILVSGQLRNTLFGLSIAKSGIWNHIDTFVRDPQIASQVKVTVVNGDASSLLEKNYKEHPRTGKYIDRMIEKEAQSQSIPSVNLYEFARDYYDDGIDPVAPVVKDAGNHISLDGIGLFLDDRYITKIEMKDSLVFTFLRGNFKQGEISIELGEQKNELVMFSLLIGTSNISVKQDANGKPTVTISVKINGSILEYIGKLTLSNDADRHKLEQMIAKDLSERGNQMIKLMQENKVDSVGIGMYVRNSMSYKAWKSLDWRDVYSKMNVKCNVEVKIKDYGKFK
jgi:spore germination protein